MFLFFGPPSESAEPSSEARAGRISRRQALLPGESDVLELVAELDRARREDTEVIPEINGREIYLAEKELKELEILAQEFALNKELWDRLDHGAFHVARLRNYQRSFRKTARALDLKPLTMGWETETGEIIAIDRGGYLHLVTRHKAKIWSLVRKEAKYEAENEPLTLERSFYETNGLQQSLVTKAFERLRLEAERYQTERSMRLSLHSAEQDRREQSLPPL